jgi:phosphoglycolate phosphatase-like HAD superfamily hydrolase/tRNA(Arg) A34 adenosine deaminase TadA
MPLDALVFDLDGTLIDTNDAHVESWVRAIERHGYRVARDRIAPEIGKGGDHLFPDVFGASAEERDGDAVRKTVGEEYVRIVREERRVRLFDGVFELLDALRERGLKTAVATSSAPEHLEATLESAGVGTPERGPLRDRLDAVVTKGDVAESKPAPDVVLAAVRKLGLSPAQCAMVGDTPHDAESAKRAGVVTLGVVAGRLNDERALVRAGARRVWRDPAHLLAELDEALRVASPGRARLSPDVLERLMREALAAAEEGMAAGEAPIGCVIADGDARVVARAHNEQNRTGNPTAHAEIVAFARAAGRLAPDARDHILVSTLEPCVMCTGAAMEGAIDTIVYGLQAPADSGTGRVRPPESPESQMPRIVGDVLAAESRRLFERWLEAHDGEPQAAYVHQLLGLVKRREHGTRTAPREDGARGDRELAPAREPAA